jgi:hypothetical protein
MLFLQTLSIITLLTINAYAQALTLSGTNSPEPTVALGPDGVPTGSGVSYLSYTSTITAAASSSFGTGSIAAASSAFAAANSSSSSNSSTTSSDSVTLLVGSASSSSTLLNGTATTANATQTSSYSSSSPPPTNTQPCNNYPQFCERSCSNITYVAAHNSPFVRAGNAASNQELPVLDQLNDGIRMLQFQTHYQNRTMWLCHTSCDLLNVGKLVDYFETVAEWLRSHPYEVITILMGNSDLVPPTTFTAPIADSGLDNFVYTPPKIPMSLEDWPKLSSMILRGKRAVVFMDYNANQTAVPYILDEFSQLWETPFSPQNRSFPCTVQRPPALKEKGAKERMYMANHNLNQEFSILGADLLVPNTVLLNETNAVSGFGSLGAMAENCTRKWDRPPNFLLVDYYNSGSSNGSVFEVAAMMNNVTCNRTCCGLPQSVGSRLERNWILLFLWVGLVTIGRL